MELDALNWLDVLVGFQASPVIDLGFRLSIGHDLHTQKDLDGDNEGELRDSSSATSVNIVGSVGYGDADDNFYLDGAVLVEVSYRECWTQPDGPCRRF